MSRRSQILTEVDTLLKTISIANGFRTDPLTGRVRYGDGTPSEYEAGIELSYMMSSRDKTVRNQRWEWDASLQVTATIYNDATFQSETDIEADIYQLFGANRSLSGAAQTVRPDGDPDLTEIAVSGVPIQMLTINLRVYYTTPEWET